MRADLLTCRYGAARRTTVLWLGLPVAYFGIVHPWRAGPAWTSSALEQIAGVLPTLDAALVLGAIARFRRARLILD